MHATIESVSARVVHIVAASLTAAVVASCAGADPSPEPPPQKVIQVTTETAVDPSDPAGVAGWADAIFVGTVQKYLTTAAPESGMPETQFRVSVVDALKGELPASVVVNQIGGVAHNGDIIVVDGMPLISTEKTYLFITRYYAEKKWLTIANGFGATELASPYPSNRGTEPDAVKRMRDAVAHAKPFGDEALRPKLPDPASLPSDVTGVPTPPETTQTTPTSPGTASQTPPPSPSTTPGSR